jgi:hypothetical protein
MRRAPEVLTLGHVGKAADVYAFGVLLWEMYTADAPFRCAGAWVERDFGAACLPAA